MRRARLALACLAALLVVAAPSSADEGWNFRLTTPRGEIADEDDDLLVAIPAGRAWGIASGLVRLPEPGALFSADIEVRDARVSGAFLRVAYYDRGAGRPRQLEVADSAVVPAGASGRVEVRSAPPPGATHYRVRILGRLVAGAVVSDRGGIVVHGVDVSGAPPAEATPRVRRTRLIAER